MAGAASPSERWPIRPAIPPWRFGRRASSANGTKAPNVVFTGEGSVFGAREAFGCLQSFSSSFVYG
jgi:hypothetical protein